MFSVLLLAKVALIYEDYHDEQNVKGSTFFWSQSIFSAKPPKQKNNPTELLSREPG